MSTNKCVSTFSLHNVLKGIVKLGFLASGMLTNKPTNINREHELISAI